MKKISILIVSIIFLLIANSCKKDEVEDVINTPDPIVVPDPTSYFQYEGKKYEITKCFAEFSSFGATNTDDFTVNLTPDNVVYDSWMQDLDGEGDGIVLNIAVPKGTNFPTNNTFVFDSLNNQIEPWELYASKLLFDGDFFMESGTIVYLKSGQCIISNGSTAESCKVEGNFKTDDGKSVIVHFEGSKRVY